MRESSSASPQLRYSRKSVLYYFQCCLPGLIVKAFALAFCHWPPWQVRQLKLLRRRCWVRLFGYPTLQWDFHLRPFLQTHSKPPLSNPRAPHWRQNQPLTWPCLPRLWWKVFLRGALIARQNVQCSERNLKSCRNVHSVRAALILCYTARLIETASNNW